MKINAAGIELIKSFESCKLKAYKPVSTEKYYTIGWGHNGQDVAADEVWTQEKADEQFVVDLVKYENYVKKYVKFGMNENQFSALVSFCYNCGVGNLKKLVQNRTASQVSSNLLKYNKSSGKVLNGLTRRREAEKILFDSKVETTYEVRITANSGVVVRSNASTKAKRITAISKGTKVIICKTTNGWGYASEYKGWICMKYTKRII